MIVYKVVREKLISAVATGAWCLFYEPGIPTKNVGTYLYAFDSLVNAQKFTKNGITTFEIWEAEGKVVDKLPTIISSSLLDLLGEAFWKHEEGITDYQAPLGSVWCEEITLVRRAA